jgi:hypothetical protein
LPGKKLSIAVAIPGPSGPEAAVLLVSPVRSSRFVVCWAKSRGCGAFEFTQLAVATADAAGNGGLS